MNDVDPACASEQVFVAGCDNTLPRAGSPYGIPPPDPHRDWHRADIIAAIRKTGTTLSALSRQHGMSDASLYNVLVHKWPRAELLIATQIQVPPWVIWPSRYPDENAWLTQPFGRHRCHPPGNDRKTDSTSSLSGNAT